MAEWFRKLGGFVSDSVLAKVGGNVKLKQIITSTIFNACCWKTELDKGPTLVLSFNYDYIFAAYSMYCTSTLDSQLGNSKAPIKRTKKLFTAVAIGWLI